jgi:hypothetical protein
LSGRVLVSDVIRLRSLSPSSLAAHRGRSASRSCRSTNVPDVAAPHCIQRSRNPGRLAACRWTDTQLVDRTIHLLAEGDMIELVEYGLVEALADTIGLRALGFGARMICGAPARLVMSALGSTGLRIWRERRVGNRAAQEIERLLERTVVFLVWRYVGLRASLFVAFRLEVAAQ